jgi:hypothetical protein
MWQFQQTTMKTKLVYVNKIDKNKNNYQMHQQKKFRIFMQFFFFWMNYISWMKANHKWYFYIEFHLSWIFMDGLSFHYNDFKSTSFIKRNLKKIWIVNSKPFNWLSICWNLIYKVVWILKGLLSSFKEPSSKKTIMEKTLRGEGEAWRQFDFLGRNSSIHEA